MPPRAIDIRLAQRFVHRTSESATSLPLLHGIGICATFFADEDAEEEESGRCWCCGLARATLCAIPEWYTNPVDRLPQHRWRSPKSEACPEGPVAPPTRPQSVTRAARAHAPIHGPATVMPGGRGRGCSCLQRAGRTDL